MERESAHARAILMVSMEPPAALEEEFNDWYDTEHFPQRRAMPGFLSASRWICLDGWPRWMALYDLQDKTALDSDVYRANAGERSTPWSRRLLPRTIGRRRVVAEAVPGQAAPLAVQCASAKTARLVLAGIPVNTREEAARVHAAATDALASSTVRDALLQLRGFFEISPDSESDAQAEQGTAWLLAAFATPVSRADLGALTGRLAGRGATTLNVYSAYHRGP